MERTTWTDERLDDLARRIDSRFDRIDRRFDRLEDVLRTEIGDLRGMLVRIGGGVIVGLLGVITAVISTG